MFTRSSYDYTVSHKKDDAVMLMRCYIKKDRKNNVTYVRSVSGCCVVGFGFTRIVMHLLDFPPIHYRSKTGGPRTSLNDGQLFKAIVVTIISFCYITLSKWLANPMSDVISTGNSYLNVSYRFPQYFLKGVV